ncbi:MAG: DMT family transporter [Oscillospiraceae bacterium]
MKPNIYQRKTMSIILAVFCAIAWAMAFPLIKIGFASLEITDAPGKSLFAGIRFFFAGILTIIIGLCTKKSFKIKTVSDWGILLFFGLINTGLHYFFFYLGLSHLSGGRSAIIDSLSTFLLILLSSLIYADDNLSIRKTVGCILGLSGIIIINFSGSGFFSGISFVGDGMLIMSAVCSAFGGILTRVATKNIDIIPATGISLSFGGMLLIIIGLIGGGKITHWTLSGVVALVLLILISSLSFTIYNNLICYNPVSKIAIFNSLIPILGVIFSCIILGEKFSVKYIIAGIIVAVGIYIVNSSKNSQK